MKTLAIIPAKSTSQGIPNKNLIKLGGHELIKHTLDAVSMSNMVDHIVIATDSTAILGIASKYSFLKSYAVLPAYLTTASVQVAEAALYAYRDTQERIDRDYDTIIVLQPTSPFRTAQHIDEALQLYQDVNNMPYRLPLDQEKDIVFSVWEPGWSYNMDGEVYAQAYNHDPRIRLGRQDVDSMGYVTENGAIYIVDAKQFTQTKSFRSSQMIPYYMDKQSSIEIDEPIDLAIAEAILAHESSS